jgi:hypothetical protein
MPNRTVADLITYLKELQLHGRPRPVLLLGAGASKGAGLAAMEELFVRIGLNPKDADVRDRFCDYISRKPAAARYELLEDHLQSLDPGAVTPGYRALADLCAARFFDLVLTANFDPLLDDALASANLKRRHYVLLINGVIRPERMNLLLSQPEPRLKIIKLHGDLFYRQMAWTAAEMDDYLESIWPQLSTAVAGRDFLTVGYSLKDARILSLVLGAGGKVWFTNYSEYPDHLSATDRTSLEEVVSTECAFETLFTRLAQELGVTPGPVAAAAPQPVAEKAKPSKAPAKTKIARARATVKRPRAKIPTAETVDDLLAALVGVWNPKFNLIGMTGFILAEPRVIVIDGAMSDSSITGFEINEIVTHRGVHLPAKPIRVVPGDPFGPLLLEVPKELEVPGLQIDLALVKAGLPIQIGVAVRHTSHQPKKVKQKTGEMRREDVSFGLSSGTVMSGQEKRMGIHGFDKEFVSEHVVELACAVAPGSSGAPVVDEKMAVRGFIIGGGSDLQNPLSLMLPASGWGTKL